MLTTNQRILISYSTRWFISAHPALEWPSDIKRQRSETDKTKVRTLFVLHIIGWRGKARRGPGSGEGWKGKGWEGQVDRDGEHWYYETPSQEVPGSYLGVGSRRKVLNPERNPAGFPFRGCSQQIKASTQRGNPVAVLYRCKINKVYIGASVFFIICFSWASFS